MIELCEECDYSILIADLIATLMVLEKHKESFVVKMWCNTSELPFIFTDDSHFNFLQEGLRVERNGSIKYIFYDVITCIEVLK